MSKQYTKLDQQLFMRLVYFWTLTLIGIFALILELRKTQGV